MIVWVLLHALIAIGFAWICHGAGSLILRRAPFEDAGLRIAAATALGYGLLGQCLFVLGLLGWLNRVAAGSLFGVAIVAAAIAQRIRSRDVSRAPVRRPLLVLIAIGSIPSLLIAMYPPVGFDGTMYHLVFARLFAESGRLVFAEALRFPVFPQLAEMHYTAALLLISDQAAQLTGWLALPVTALATASLVRQAGGGERAEWLAAALWLGTPCAIYLCASSYIDVTLTMFVTLAAACTAPSLAGAFAGMGAATKYHGLFFLFTLPWRNVRGGSSQGRSFSFRAILLFLVMGASFAAPWYVRIVDATGNPLFPYMRGLFGDHEYRTRIDQTMLRATGDPLQAAAMLPREPPFVTIIDRGFIGAIRFGVPPHSPVIIFLLPLVLAAAVLAPRLRQPLILAVLYVVIVSPLDWRFMVAVVPLFAAAIGWCGERIIPRKGTLAAIVICILPGFAWGTLFLTVKFGPMPHTPAQREAFLAKRIRVYRAVHSLGRTTVYVLGAPNMAYYCPGRCLGDFTGPYGYGKVFPLLHEPQRLAERLRGFGATHLVLDRSKTQFAPGPPFRLVYRDAQAEAYAIGEP